MKNAVTTNSSNAIVNPEDDPSNRLFVGPETLLLSMFDIEELAVLESGELRLLAAVAEVAEEKDVPLDDYSGGEYIDTVRMLLVQPQSQETSDVKLASTQRQWRYEPIDKQ